MAVLNAESNRYCPPAFTQRVWVVISKNIPLKSLPSGGTPPDGIGNNVTGGNPSVYDACGDADVTDIAFLAPESANGFTILVGRVIGIF